MNETKHTPGPWRVSGNEKEVYAKHPHGFVCPFVVSDCSGREQFGPLATEHFPETAKANARLIAAAPDLLAACKAYFYGEKPDRECEAMMGAAIAKAEGSAK
jgi:hypothetical protein